MSRIIELCKELAAEIASSDEYNRVKAAEAAVEADKDALALVFDYREKYRAMTEMFGRQDEQPEEFREAARALQEVEDDMGQNPIVREMMEAQSAFSTILGQVNTILQNALGTPDGGASCSGDCSSCGGCAGNE